MKILIPPIKCQGIKSKLVAWILDNVKWDGLGKWIEPFMGSGVVGFNLNPKEAIFCDINPHLVNFYKEINEGKINAIVAKQFLESEGEKLSEKGQDYYYEVRNRFNKFHDPLDFLFLNRACFNGIIRFNDSGEFNVPFGHKPMRFSQSYITKIVNQVKWVSDLTKMNHWEFLCQDFRRTLSNTTSNDFVYCDPPYAGRHTDYFNSWSEKDEISLYEHLINNKASFILSTWHSNQHRDNPYIDKLWSKFDIITREHFYHVGAKETNRKPMLEALVVSYETYNINNMLILQHKAEQLTFQNFD
jgi:DNA adenine methylase